MAQVNGVALQTPPNPDSNTVKLPPHSICDDSLKLDVWKTELCDDFHQNYLLNGIEHGFDLVDNDITPIPVECPNYLSATDPTVKDKVERQILTEIEQGHYTIVNKRPVIVSAMGAIPKQGSTDVRIIHDCSRPIGTSLNDFATKESVKYQTIEEAVGISSPNCFYAKVDLKSAYRSVKIHPSNHKLTGLKWLFQGEGTPTYLIDNRLPFGARKSPAIFHHLTQAVRRMMNRRGFNNIIVYLDDFLIVANSKDECITAMNVLINLLRKLGFAINWSKVAGPSKSIIFLGINFDSVNFQLTLPDNKVSETLSLLQEFLNKRRASKRQLQRLAGKLNWASRVVRGGRTYLRRVLNLQNSIKSPLHKARLTDDFLQDILWWNQYLLTFNGVSMLRRPEGGVVHIDACNVASGIAFNGDWAYTMWESDWPEVAPLHINFKEVLSVLIAARRWGHLWANMSIYILTDSECAKHIIRKGTTPNPLVMRYMRELFWISAKYNFELFPIYVRGKENILPDTISRLNETGQFTQLQSLLWQYFGAPLHPLQLRFHMSPKSLSFLIFQILQWWPLRPSWIKRSGSIVPSPLRNRPNVPMSAIDSRFFDSVPPWGTHPSPCLKPLCSGTRFT